MNTYTLHQGTAPLLISLPHDGSEITDDISRRMVPAAQRSPDTDWHVGKLYDFAREMGASLIKPRYSRYVVDLNRPNDGHAMYPGKKETGLVPTIMFSGDAIYRDDEAIDDCEVARRIRAYWKPYHDSLAQELARIKAAHGRAVLWDGHSIRGHVPMLFEGRLPDLNLGTADGASCRKDLVDRLAAVLAAQSDYDHVCNGRFKGGHITRHYGQPEQKIDAVQLEMVQACYMDEGSFQYIPERASKVQPLIRQLLQACLD